MAIYRLASYPEPPPEMVRNTPKIAVCFVASLLTAPACFPLMYHAQAISNRFDLPGLLLPNAIALFCVTAIIATVISGLALLARRKYLREYGQQSWELTPEVLSHSYQGKPDKSTPIDALLGFSVRRGRTTVRAADGFTRSLLPSTLAERDGFWDQLRGMGVPEGPSSSLWTSLLKALPSFAVISIFLILLLFSGNLLVRLLGYLLYMGRLQWSTTLHEDPTRSPMRQRHFYVGLLSSTLMIWVILLPTHSHHKHGTRHPRAANTSTPGGASWDPASTKHR